MLNCKIVNQTTIFIVKYNISLSVCLSLSLSLSLSLIHSLSPYLFICLLIFFLYYFTQLNFFFNIQYKTTITLVKNKSVLMTVKCAEDCNTNERLGVSCARSLNTKYYLTSNQPNFTLSSLPSDKTTTTLAEEEGEGNKQEEKTNASLSQKLFASNASSNETSTFNNNTTTTNNNNAWKKNFTLNDERNFSSRKKIRFYFIAQISFLIIMKSFFLPI